MRNILRNSILLATISLIVPGVAFSQKGIDDQNRKIQEDTNKTTQTVTENGNSGGGRVIDWGGKAKVRAALANPYRLTSRRDMLIESVMDVLHEKKIIVDDASSRMKDGIIITQPFIFAKGSVITKSELGRYAVIPFSDASWTRGRYTLTVEIQSIDGIQNNVSVTAKIEGRSENGLLSEWTTLQSKGVVEDEILRKLVEAVTGVSFEEPKPGQ